MTAVWLLFEPRSHGRKKAATRAHNGALLPGRAQCEKQNHHFFFMNTRKNGGFWQL